MSYANERDATRTDAVESLLAECLELEPFQRARALSNACSTHPELASDLRARWSALIALGVLDSDAGAGDDDFPEHLGDFHLLERIGGGGMGVVYLARQRSLDRDVALKLVRPEHLFFPRARVRFQREAEAVARLAHPGIVPIHTVGEEHGIPFFAMELVRGCTLGHALAKLESRAPESLSGRDLYAIVCAEAKVEPALPQRSMYALGWIDLCLTIARQVADALEHAHSHGVLHRDVKPSNIMLTPDGRALLLDFGLAAAIGNEGATRTGMQVGTLHYMSPEQVRAVDELDARTDVYGLGLTLYEMLTLQLPYRGADALETQRLILAGRPDSIRARNRRVPADVEVVCRLALDVDRRRRYSSAAAFARDLFNLLEHRPIAARSPGPVLRARRWAQRRPALATGLVLGLALVVAVPLLLWRQQVQRVEQEWRRINDLRDSLHASGDELQFVLGLFSRAGGRSPSAPVSVLDVLAAGDSGLGAFADRPISGARMRMYLARSYLALDEPARALPLLESAVAYYRDEKPAFPDNHVFEASVMLGDALARLQRVDEAKPLLEAAIEHYSAEPPGPYNKLDYARTALASVLTAQHEERRAWELVRTVLDNLREHGADLHDEGVARELADFATMLFKQGRFAESEQVWREALVGLRDALGPRHEELVNALCNLGIAIKMQNRLDDAEPYYSEALAMAHELWSEPNETTGGLALNYGGLQEKRKDFEGAENAYREAADTFVRVLGPDSTKEAYARGNLAGMFARNGRCEEAEAMYAEVLPLQLRALPNSDPVPGFSHLNLAHCARERGEWAAAIEHYQRALDYWREAGSCEGYIARANAEMKELEAGVDDTAEKQ